MIRHDTPPALTPAVSIVMPCFNAMGTIEASIASVQSQSLQDWELIVVDDGSTDRSWDLVKDIAGTDRRVRIIGQRNAGPAVARNAGVRQSRGPIVAFLDADDLWSDGHLEHHCRRLEADERLGISFSPSLFMDEDGRPTGEGTRAPEGPLGIGDLLSGNPTGTCSALVVRRAVFDTAGFMRDDMIHAEDQEWLIRVLHAGWWIACVPEIPIRYRISRGSLSSSVDKMLDGWKVVIRHARDYFPDEVAREEAHSLARMHLYFARRTIRSTGNRRSSFRHIAKAISGHPALVLRSPASLLVTAAICAAPLLIRNLRSTLSGHRHA
jgi:glycosyltransferase involved in cell wall biosynthesis